MWGFEFDLLLYYLISSFRNGWYTRRRQKRKGPHQAIERRTDLAANSLCSRPPPLSGHALISSAMISATSCGRLWIAGRLESRCASCMIWQKGKKSWEADKDSYLSTIIVIEDLIDKHSSESYFTFQLDHQLKSKPSRSSNLAQSRFTSQEGFIWALLHPKKPLHRLFLESNFWISNFHLHHIIKIQSKSVIHHWTCSSLAWNGARLCSGRSLCRLGLFNSHLSSRRSQN